MNIISSFKNCVYNKYADFDGKSSRSEYWWFWLVYWLILFGLPVIVFLIHDTNFGRTIYLFFAILWVLSAIMLLCPFIAVSIRRLHDAGLSGWHFLWRFVPYIGSIITFFLMIKKTKDVDIE